ncbi:MAG: beta-propeller fold lactonase family protein, partial [Bryobacteraceae bacterium]
PPLPDPFDLPNDPPDPFDNPFDPINDLPDPFDSPFPPDTDLPPLPDPFDLPEPDLPDLPDPFDEPSLFPDPIDDLPDPFDDLPPLPDLPEPVEIGQALPGPHLATPRVATSAPATNIPAKLMPFPRPILFPVALTVSAASSTTQCDPNFSSTLLIPEANTNTLAFLGTCPHAINAHVVVGNGPVSVAVARDGQNAWVANAVDGTVSVVNLASKTSTQTIPLSIPDGSPAEPNQIAFLPNGTLAYVSDHECNPGSFILIVSTSTYQTVGNIPTGCYPSSMAVTPDGAQLWVSQRGDNRVDVYDTVTNAHVFGFNVPNATGIGFNPSGTIAYIAGFNTPGTIQVIDMQTYQQIAQITVGDDPHVVAVTPTGKHVFVTNMGSNSISQIDTATNTVLRTLQLPNNDQHPLGLNFIR